MSISINLHNPIPVARLSSSTNRVGIIRFNHNITFDQPKPSSTGTAVPISNIPHLHVEGPRRVNLVVKPSSKHLLRYEEKLSVPAESPKEIIGSKWREIHGSMEWSDLLDPLHPWLRQEIIKYGEFAQATYEGFDFDHFSDYCGSCKYNKRKLLSSLGLAHNGYEVTEYVYAMSHLDMPSWLERSRLVNPWSKDSNWVGFVAVSNDEEKKRIGRRDIVVAWRGTVAPLEWYDNLQRNLEPFGHGEARVEHGFLSMYTSRSDSTRYNKCSASEQAMKEIRRLIEFYRARGEEVSLTITGHSLGGALALFNAYEAARAFPGVHTTVISFAAPRAGNAAFRDELRHLGVKILRVVLKQDIVPKMPGFILNEGLERFEEITGELEWVFTHAGKELKLDACASPYLKRGFHPIGFHSVETYLHLVDGFVGSGSGFRPDARRDVALVNKACGLLVDELRIPSCWYQEANKGLVRDEYGRWVKPKRDPEDIPSPTKAREFLR